MIGTYGVLIVLVPFAALATLLVVMVFVGLIGSLYRHREGTDKTSGRPKLRSIAGGKAVTPSNRIWRPRS